MKKIIITIIAFISLNCHAGWDDWSDFDKKLFVASQIAITADWATTRYGSRHYAELPHLKESNVILGPYPSTRKVDLYFVGMLVSNYYIADYVDSKNRTFYLTIRTVAHGAAAINNVNFGWQMKF
jgi:hypothetical protein